MAKLHMKCGVFLTGTTDCPLPNTQVHLIPVRLGSGYCNKDMKHSSETRTCK